MNRQKQLMRGRISLFRLTVLLLLMLLTLGLGIVNTQAAQNPETAEDTVATDVAEVTSAITPTVKPVIKRGLIKSGNTYCYYTNGRMVKNTWKKVNGNYYWFKANGKAAVNGYYNVKGVYYVFDKNACRLSPGKNAVVRVNGDRYFVDAKGRAVKGWNELNNKMYYVYANGKCATGTTVEGIKFDKYGVATDLTQARCKLAAKAFIERHTTSQMNNYTKFRTCFRYIMAYTKFSPRKRPSKAEFQTTTWVYKYALDMFQTNLTGNCYGISSCVAAIAKELGYVPYVVTITADHSFVTINGLYYDNMYGTLFGASTRPAYVTSQRIKF